jgi:putative Holliday junction resolvase
MKYLGIDFGLKRVGLAVTDPDGRMALPYATLVREDNASLFSRLADIVATERIQAIVLGLPRGLEGQETIAVRQVRNFAATLQKHIAVPVHLVDESLTTTEAEQRLREAGVPPARRKHLVDQQAATIILESFLHRLASGDNPGEDKERA